MGTNTGIGIGIGIPFKNNALGGDRPYLPPELKAKLIGVWDNYGKKNTDADRNIIKNKIPNAGGDLEILNAAYEGMSGYNGYPVVFGANKTWRYKAHGGGSSYIYTINDNKYNFTQIYTVAAWAYSYIKQNGELTDYNKDVTSFKIKVTGLEPDKFIIKYNYLSSTDATVTSGIVINSDGIYELPKSFANDGSLIDNYGWIGFGFAKMSTDIPNTITGVNVTIEVLPEHEGAFVTDGVDDMIVSQNPVSEMLGGSKELTVVSMIHQISPVPDSYGFTNYIREGSIWSRTNVKTSGKTGIYGYKISKGNTEMGASNLINNILGDKADYEAMGYNITNYSDINYSVAGYIKDGSPTEVSSVAWYWTFIAKRVLTTDEINQVIAYYNLDKYVKPDIYYNVKKQGLTNDNHAQFGDKLIDYSGNSRDLQLFNIGWNPGSGIGKYVTNFGIWSKDAESKISYNSYSFTVNDSLKRTWLMWYVTELPSFKIKVSGINSNGYVDYGYYDNGSLKNFRLDKDGIHTLPPSGASSNGHGFKVNDTSLDWTGLVIEQIPDFAGALCFDGVDDYGKFVGDLGLKDYTVVIDRAYPIVSTPQFTATSDTAGENANTPFLVEHRDVNANEFTYSYLADTAISINKEREICYQSTYQYKDTVINKGSSTSLGTGLTIARYGINNDYSALALYSFMLFHYSMSKFLIERQLKKHKLGTLYPSMVEFRPIIKSNIDIKNIVYLDKDSNVVKAGDYISIGSNIKTSITVLDGYKISKVSSTAFNNITIEKSNTDFIYDVIFYGIKKSPQKINLVIEQDSDYVQWNPNIKANVSKYSVTANIRKTDGTTLKLVNGQFYSTSITGNLVLDIVPPNKDLDEVTNVIIDGKSYTPIKYQYTDYYRVEIPLIFPQEINVIIDEYITYETIEQPYPIFLNYIDKETNKAYTWGDKVKIDSILKISGYKNLFENGDTSLGGSNGYSVNGSSELIPLGTLLTSEILVNKINTGVRSSVIWNLDTPKPLFAYDPSIINNVGLKNLGYLPDITGQGRHLLLNEFAYEGMSGINGYPVVLGVNKTWETVSGTANYTSYITSNNIHVTHVKRANNDLLYSYVKLNGELTNIKEIPSFKVNIKGLEGNSRVRYYYLATENATSNSVLNLKNGINEISKSFIPTDTLLNNSNNVWIGFSISAISDEVNSFDCDITIEILPNYEGALCFDGINDYGTVSNLSSQYIKTLLMKVNWMKDTPMLLYDQRGGNYFGILTTQESDINNTKIAYQARNPNGKTYIDGIENNYIETYTLKDITHNITITNSNVNTIVTPVIGSNSGHSANFAQMAMYKVMGLPEIPSDEEIKTINNWAGIEAKVELPSYYWDAYGKTNLDADRGYIKDQVSLQLNNDNTNDNSLKNFNFGYEGMSGYNGYPIVFGANKTWTNIATNDGTIWNYELTPTSIAIYKSEPSGSFLIRTWVISNGVINSVNIPEFKIKISNLKDGEIVRYHYISNDNNSVVSSVSLKTNGIHTLPASVPIVTEDVSTNKSIGFTFKLNNDENVDGLTIEVLPEYENGLVYNGVSDFSQNTNIETTSDFTFLVKALLLKGFTGSGGCIARKGDKNHYDTGGYAFIYCFDSPIESYRNSYYSFGKSFIPSEGIVAPPLIGYMTKTSVNGVATTFGTNSDMKGILFGNWANGYMNMVIYKSIFYTKTISLLEINFLKNLMEKNEIIDINHPIFISNTEDESNTSQDT